MSEQSERKTKSGSRPKRAAPQLDMAKKSDDSKGPKESKKQEQGGQSSQLQALMPSVTRDEASRLRGAKKKEQDQDHSTKAQYPKSPAPNEERSFSLQMVQRRRSNEESHEPRGQDEWLRGVGGRFS